MAYWRDTLTIWLPDQPLHAGITRGAMQDNITVMGEQAYCDIDSEPLGSTTNTILYAKTGAWEPSTSWNPQPIRALKAANGVSWRDVSIYFRCELIGAGSCSLRIFLLPRENPMTINPVSGMIGDFDFKQITVPAFGSPDWHGGAITPSEVHILPVSGVEIPLLWMHVFCNGTVETYLHNTRIVEGAF